MTPIICTHAGCTGQSIMDRVKYLLRTPADAGDVYVVCYLKPKGPYVKDVYFNCSSINLYNEDIEAILVSGGLTGLSFDQRILGFADENVLRDVTVPNDVEYISKQESAFFPGLTRLFYQCGRMMIKYGLLKILKIPIRYLILNSMLYSS